MWVAFLVDYPSKSFRTANTEAEIDAAIVDLDAGGDEVVKREFDKLDMTQAEEFADLLL